VLFATPGMLNGGVSLEVFKHWAPDPNNHVVLPGYQVLFGTGFIVNIYRLWHLCTQAQSSRLKRLRGPLKV
jgi:Cft2 family RNA processing exonuclease